VTAWTLRQIVELLAFPVAIAAGQILFKRAATLLDPAGGSNWLMQLLTMPTMWVALALYGGATVLWVRILTTVPLSRAYPFVALAFVLVPAAGYLFFSEPITPRYVLGTAIVIAGVLVVARG
jgi:drug/metabolite transporter (DMT)-like permease